jgi:hypothetical protein
MDSFHFLNSSSLFQKSRLCKPVEIKTNISFTFYVDQFRLNFIKAWQCVPFLQ